jgi:hypothetical protein
MGVLEIVAALAISVFSAAISEGRQDCYIFSPLKIFFLLSSSLFPSSSPTSITIYNSREPWVHKVSLGI